MAQAEIVHRDIPRSLGIPPIAFGTATMVLSAERRGELWVAQQKIKKEVTGRKANVIDVFTETAVVEADGSMENAENNRIASLAEMMSNDDVTKTGSDFHLVFSEDRFHPSVSTPGVFFRRAIIIFGGDPTYQFTPTASDEVGQSFLLAHGELKGEGVRPLAEEVVQGAVDDGLLEEAYRRYDAGEFLPAFPSDFSDIETFDILRSKKPDYIIYESNESREKRMVA